ncbi:MAG: hypothetical protein M3Z41_10605 [Candidatus Eremiobacteraeota bacterium]|nr:hypothetical protein [Candidatus Eremiobacteraeota bacterium]
MVIFLLTLALVVGLAYNFALLHMFLRRENFEPDDNPTKTAWLVSEPNISAMYALVASSSPLIMAGAIVVWYLRQPRV